MVFYCWIIIYFNLSSCKNEILQRLRRLIALYFFSSKKRLYYLRTFSIFFNQPFFRRLINHKGFVQSGFNPVKNFPINIFSERYPLRFYFLEQVGIFPIAQPPPLGL